MSETAIRVEGLGKRYQLGQRERYKALRDTLTDLAAAPLRLLRGGRTQQSAAGEFWALRDVSFAIGHGEVVGIIGRNGAGKSTLLKLLSRITRPSEGRIHVRGRVGSLLEVGTGFHPELTGRENIYLNGAILGMKRHEIERKFDEIVEFAEVEQFLDTPVKRFSSGMYTRLAFSVAAHLEPEILVVDEVLAVGDAAFQKKCLGKMGEVAKEGRTVLFVSHNMAAIANLCTDALLLERGHILDSGRVDRVISRYLEMAQSFSIESLQDRIDRQGSGKLRFVDVAAYGADRQMAVSSGMPMSIDIGYEGTAPIRNVHISVGLYTPFGEGCLYLSNDLVGSQLDDLPERGRLRCTFDRLPVLPGTYTINIYCTINGVLADWVVNAARIDVEGGDYFGTGKLPPPGYGSVTAMHQWSVVE